MIGHGGDPFIFLGSAGARKIPSRGAVWRNCVKSGHFCPVNLCFGRLNRLRKLGSIQGKMTENIPPRLKPHSFYGLYTGVPPVSLRIEISGACLALAGCNSGIFAAFESISAACKAFGKEFSLVSAERQQVRPILALSRENPGRFRS